MSQDQISAAARIEREPGRIRVLFGGHEIADSADVLVLREAGRPPVRYFPRGDVEMTVLGQTSRRTVSATKGQATYFTLRRDGRILENVVWSFETPPAAFAPIAGRIAFVPGPFDLEGADGEDLAWDPDAGPAAPFVAD